MKPQDCIFFCLSNVGKRAGRYWKDHVAPFGVTGVQAMVLNFLLDEDAVSSVELGNRAALDSATLTGVLDRLEGTGLVLRRTNQGDRRAISVCLTETGRAVAEATTAMIAEANSKYLKNLTGEDVIALKRLLNKL